MRQRSTLCVSCADVCAPLLGLQRGFADEMDAVFDELPEYVQE